MVRGHRSGPKDGQMTPNVPRIVVIAPGMEKRPLPDWALEPISDCKLTPTEHKVREIGQRNFGKESVVIEGLPWVNPNGRGKPFASTSDYLDDPVQLLRALQVSFSALTRGAPMNGALVAVDGSLRGELEVARDWVMPRLRSVPDNLIVWWVFNPDVEAGLQSDCFTEALEPFFK